MYALVTGASGFIGRSLCQHLLAEGWQVRASTASDAGEAALRALSGHSGRLEIVRVPHFCDTPEGWRDACRECDVVFHLAGIAHRGDGRNADPDALYRRGNVDVTLALAQAAAEAGVSRFVFASSITVYGNASPAGMPFTEISAVAPAEGYARSKLEAETGLLRGDWNDMQVTIVRLPLVYGAGVKGNLRAFLKLVALGLPLPFARLENRRSFVNLANLVDFLRCAALHENAANRILLVSDREDLSTPALIRAIARGLGQPARLFPFPPNLLKTACTLLGQGIRYEKLSASFQIDPAVSCALLGWHPTTCLAEGIIPMCAAYRKTLATPRHPPEPDQDTAA